MEVIGTQFMKIYVVIVCRIRVSVLLMYALIVVVLQVRAVVDSSVHFVPMVQATDSDNGRLFFSSVLIVISFRNNFLVQDLSSN